MNFDLLAPTLASLLFAALSLLFIFLLPVNWTRAVKYVRVTIDQRLTKEEKHFWRMVGRMLYIYILVLIGVMR